MIGFLDVSRAHFVSGATRELYLELLDVAKVPGQDLVARHLRSFYGTRDAGHNWDIQKARVLLIWVSSKILDTFVLLYTLSEIYA